MEVKYYHILLKKISNFLYVKWWYSLFFTTSFILTKLFYKLELIPQIQMPLHNWQHFSNMWTPFFKYGGYRLLPQPNVLNLVSTNNFPLQLLDPSNSSDISFLDQMKFFIDHCVFNNGNIRQQCNSAKLLLITYRIPT